MSGLLVTEGVSGVWHYHLSKPESRTRGLCGAQVMSTAIELKDWGKPFGDHFPKPATYCKTCDKFAKDQHDQ